jgi:nucleoside phosphorylase
MNRRLCLITAADIEFRLAADLLSNPITTIGEDLQLTSSSNITLLKTEIGAVGFSDKLNRHLATNKYDAVLIAGFGGALDPECRKNEAVVYERCISALDGRSVACDRVLSERISAVVDAHRGIGLTTERVIIDASEKQELYKKFGAMVVDMESYGVLDVCARNDLPAAVLRVISDAAEDDLPDFNRILQPDGKIDNRKVLGALLGRPRASWRFVQSMRPAGEALKAALRSAVSDL